MAMDDRRLIEDYLPLDDLNAVASKEKLHPRRYVELVHYWPARRPITASRAAIAFERTVAEDEIDLDSGFLIAPAALPAPEKPAAATLPTGGGGGDGDRYPTPGGGAGAVRDRDNVTAGTERAATGSREVTLSFVADRNALYASWNALANLADAAGKVSVRVRAASDAGFDRAKLENGVLEPLRELGLIDDDDERA